eukprot:Sspe_Gene.59484::Locus_32665_Transcript_1_1_Confidence_1.000_Length_2157::g.59484::m.59484
MSSRDAYLRSLAQVQLEASSSAILARKAEVKRWEAKKGRGSSPSPRRHKPGSPASRPRRAPEASYAARTPSPPASELVREGLDAAPALTHLPHTLSATSRALLSGSTLSVAASPRSFSRSASGGGPIPEGRVSSPRPIASSYNPFDYLLTSTQPDPPAVSPLVKQLDRALDHVSTGVPPSKNACPLAVTIAETSLKNAKAFYDNRQPASSMKSVSPPRERYQPPCERFGGGSTQWKGDLEVLRAELGFARQGLGAVPCEYTVWSWNENSLAGKVAAMLVASYEEMQSFCLWWHEATLQAALRGLATAKAAALLSRMDRYASLEAALNRATAECRVWKCRAERESAWYTLMHPASGVAELRLHPDSTFVSPLGHGTWEFVEVAHPVEIDGSGALEVSLCWANTKGLDTIIVSNDGGRSFCGCDGVVVNLAEGAEVPSWMTCRVLQNEVQVLRRKIETNEGSEQHSERGSTKPCPSSSVSDPLQPPEEQGGGESHVSSKGVADEVHRLHCDLQEKDDEIAALRANEAKLKSTISRCETIIACLKEELEQKPVVIPMDHLPRGLAHPTEHRHAAPHGSDLQPASPPGPVADPSPGTIRHTTDIDASLEGQDTAGQEVTAQDIVAHDRAPQPTDSSGPEEPDYRALARPDLCEPASDAPSPLDDETGPGAVDEPL